MDQKIILNQADLKQAALEFISRRFGWVPRIEDVVIDITTSQPGDRPFEGPTPASVKVTATLRDLPPDATVKDQQQGAGGQADSTIKNDR